MEVKGKVAIVTGGATGIGRAIAERFAAAGAAGVVVADLKIASKGNGSAAPESGSSIIQVHCDVTRESDIQALVESARQRFGRVDIYVSNAGILGQTGGEEVPDALWDSMWRVHVMAHVWAARAVVPEMVARGDGYFLITASAAGLLNIVESAPYGVTKHAAVGFAEWLRIAYGRQGVRVSCLCPQSVRTPMTEGGTAGSAALDGSVSAEEVAENVIQTMRDERFLSLPHPEVAAYVQAKAQDHDRWLGGMQKLYMRHVSPSRQAAVEPPDERR